MCTFDRYTLKQFKGILRSVDNVLHQEVSLHSDTLGLAGRVDLIAEYEGVLSIIDFKTAKKRKKLEYVQDYFLQAAAYSFMMAETYGIAINQAVIIICSDDGVSEAFRSKMDDQLLNTLIKRTDSFHEEMIREGRLEHGVFG